MRRWQYEESFDDDEKLKELARGIVDEDLEDDFGGMMAARIVNIVATVNLSCEFDLFKIAMSLRNAEYNPRRFQAVIVKISDPRATGLIFKNGKMNVVGCRTEETAEISARKFAKIIRQLHYPVKFKSFEIKNMVAVADCQFQVRLESLANAFRGFAKYNPEIFSGVIFRIPEPRVTLLIFASGKIVLTAAKTQEMLQEATEWILPILRAHEKSPPKIAIPEEPPTPVEPVPVKEEQPVEVKQEVKKKRNPFKKPPKS